VTFWINLTYLKSLYFFISLQNLSIWFNILKFLLTTTGFWLHSWSKWWWVCIQTSCDDWIFSSISGMGITIFTKPNYIVGRLYIFIKLTSQSFRSSQQWALLKLGTAIGLMINFIKCECSSLDQWIHCFPH
jgi:hypothetical protein